MARLLALTTLAALVSISLAARLGHRQAMKPSQRQITSEAEKDRVQSLPGWDGDLPFGVYAGYITVDKEAGRHLFYVYVESAVSPEEDPLLLWLNGGPGCSSLGGGFMAELGPFFPLPGGKKLQVNPYSWNRVANTLFVESPAFVGFSYSETSSDAVVGDARTAKDMRNFLLGFVQRFPHLAEKDLYISGESYAGHYLPTLAWEIVEGNHRATSAVSSGQVSDPFVAGYLNFKGIAVGNPWTDAATDNLGAVDFWWAHALISDTSAQGIKANCDFSRIGPLDSHPNNTDPHTRAGACDKFCNSAMNELGPINIYHVYADVCIDTTFEAVTQALGAALTQAHEKVAAEQGLPAMELVKSGLLGAAAAIKSAAQRRAQVNQMRADRMRESLREGQGEKNPSDPDEDEGPVAYDACVDNEVEKYLNLPEVQRAIHANVSGNLPGRWQDCTRKISYSRLDLLSTMLPVWERLIHTPGLRFIVYSGDVDGIVPVVGTRRWVAALGMHQARPWRPWTSGLTGQVGGYTVEYVSPGQDHAVQQEADVNSQNGKKPGAVGKDKVQPLQGDFVFATVRGAGHMVPYVQPQRALHLIARFLRGQAL